MKQATQVEVGANETSSEMSWSKSRGRTSKTKHQAGDHQDPRALSERGHVAARLRARLEDLESRRNGLFLVTSDPLHTARECQARIQRQQVKCKV